MKIYIATHKTFDVPKNDIYIPIQVGAEINESRFGVDFVLDNTGDNISSKNKSYCELTALYWMWKNDKSDVVGLAHYRRYLTLKKHNSQMTDILSEDEINDILKKYDVIVPKKILLDHSIERCYAISHYQKDYDVLRQVVSELYSDYMDAFDKVSNNTTMHICNMMICKKELFDEYCEWLFNILFEVEKRIDISNYDTHQKRIFGFMSERLLNVWLEAKNIKIKKVNIHNTEKTDLTSFKRNLRCILSIVKDLFSKKRS